jgi:hypothetical protein
VKATSFRSELKWLINNPQFSDVILVTKEEKKVFAHRVILAVSSPYFSSQLDPKCEMQEIPAE